MPRHLAPIVLACCLGWSADAADAGQRGFRITVLVANRASVPAATIAQMQSEAGWVLSKAGISTTWIDCPFSTETAEANSPCAGLGGTRFLVRLTRDHVTHHGSIWDTTMGFAHITPNGGSYATVLMDPVEELTREQQLVSQAQILGHAVAHEIGHLVMGSNSHSPRGLMRAGWKANELRDMAERHLLFSKREGERMRIRIAIYDDAVSSNPAQHETGTRAITVRIYNLAQVPAKEVGQARDEAAQILKQDGIEVRWLSCALSLQEARTNTACEEATGRHDFDVVVSTASITRPGIATDASLGFAFPLALPSHAVVLWERSKKMSEVPAGIILGHAIAHELGHLLLHSMEHSRTGIMRSRWGKEDLLRAQKGTLLFTTEQVTTMRPGLMN